MQPVFQPALNKLEAVNRLSRLVGAGPQELGPGSKERKAVLVNLAVGLRLEPPSKLSKPELGAFIARELCAPWSDDCWSTGQTITLHGLNVLLCAAELHLHTAAPLIPSAPQQTAAPSLFEPEPISTRAIDGQPKPRVPPIEDEAMLIITTLIGASPPIWDGRECVKAMHLAGDKNWAQDEWKGFFLEYLLSACTSLGGRRQAARFGHTTIDFGLWRLWDVKAHSMGPDSVALNDATAVHECVATTGGLGFIVVSGERTIDPSFKTWFRNYREVHGKIRRPRAHAPSQVRHLTSMFKPRRFQAFHFSIDGLQEAIECKALTRMKQGRQPSGAARKEKFQLHLKRSVPFIVAEVAI